MDIRKRKLSMMPLAWCLVVPIISVSPRSIDPILTHMCSIQNGVKFWRAFLDCTVLLDVQVESALRSCIPISNPKEAEISRCSICLKPDLWDKMMECMHARLIELQDQSNPHLELSPGMLYRSCVSVLVSEADRSVNERVPFLPEDDRNFASSC